MKLFNIFKKKSDDRKFHLQKVVEQSNTLYGSTTIKYYIVVDNFNKSYTLANLKPREVGTGKICQYNSGGYIFNTSGGSQYYFLTPLTIDKLDYLVDTKFPLILNKNIIIEGDKLTLFNIM